MRVESVALPELMIYITSEREKSTSAYLDISLTGFQHARNSLLVIAICGP
jgi:hypothetical protein